MPRLELFPGGKNVVAPQTATMCDALFAEGIEFPCGGQGRCRRCKVRVLRGEWPISATDRAALTDEELREGWRLSCQGQMQGDLTLEVAQWHSPILGDETHFEFTPSDGLGIAIDLGTTTIAAQLLDLRTARILATSTALNAQGVHGADVVSRLDFAMNGGAASLTQLIRDQTFELINTLLRSSGSSVSHLRSVVIVGNTTMHHLFCGLPVDQLARDPFHAFTTELRILTPGELGWESFDAAISFLPPIGGFVGSDILAGIVATRLYKQTETCALMDLGTNGEVVVSRDGKLACASTAAGPAFEGARISAGMRAATGAIHAVAVHDEGLEFKVLGGGHARGICGSGLVDVIAAGLDVQIIDHSGRFSSCQESWTLRDLVALQQKDIRELQLAKGAIAAGLEILLQEMGASLGDLNRVYLAGAFGNYVKRESASRIGLVPVSPDKVVQAGNTALLGAKQFLFPEYREDFHSVRTAIQHIPLNDRPTFQDFFLNQIQFPRRHNSGPFGAGRRAENKLRPV